MLFLPHQHVAVARTFTDPDGLVHLVYGDRMLTTPCNSVCKQPDAIFKVPTCVTCVGLWDRWERFESWLNDR